MNRKLLQFILFLLFTFGLTAFFYLCYNKVILDNKKDTIMNNLLVQNPSLTNQATEPAITIALISDSHQNSQIFTTLKNKLKDFKPNLVIHTCDLTDFGDKQNLSIAKNDLNLLEYPIVALPGDHDIAQTVDTSNFDTYFSYPT